jgi:hypothetical protein
MNSIPGAALPVTPGNKRLVGNIAVERVVRRLNDDYALGIEIPDPSLSPSRRKQLGEQDEQYGRWDRICRGIQFLYYQRGESLDQALASFFNEAKAASLRWVPKPRADAGTLPSATRPPKAQTPGQQWNLQSILISVIDGFMAEKRTPLVLPRPNGRPVVAPALQLVTSGGGGGAGSPGSPGSPTESPGSAGSKRSFDAFDGEYDHGTKRVKGKEPATSPCPSPTRSTRSNFTDALDNVPTRQRLAHPPDWPPRQQDEERSSSTDSSNSTRVSSLFSQHDGRQSFQSTQTTLDGDLDPKRPLGTAIPTRPSPPRFSIPHRTPPVVKPPPVRDAAQQSPPRSSAVSSVSDVPAPSAASLNAPSSWGPRDNFDSFSSGELTPIQLRLQNIWRKWPACSSDPF